MPANPAAANAAPMSETTRRAFIKTGAALGTVVALAVPVAILPKAEAAEHPDAELLKLGAELEREHLVLADLKHEEARLEDVFDAEVARLNPVGWKALCAVRDETGYEAAIVRSGDQFARVDAITTKIRSIPAKTFAGLAVKARATSYDCHFSLKFDGPWDRMDWDAQCFLGFLREVDRMAAAEADRS